MSNKPLLTIAIPTWNRAGDLRMTLTAVVPQAAQFPGRCEVFVSDNASDDDTPRVCEEFARTYPGVFRFTRNSENIGGRRNIRQAGTMSAGEFFWLLGDDDMPTPGAVEHVVGLLDKHEASEPVDLLLLSSMTMDSGFSRPSVAWHERFALEPINALKHFPRGLDALRYFLLKELGKISMLVFRTSRWNETAYESYPKAWMYPHLISLVEVLSKGGAVFSPRVCFLGLRSDQTWILDRGIFSYCYEFPMLLDMAVKAGMPRRFASRQLRFFRWETTRAWLKMCLFRDQYKPDPARIALGYGGTATYALAMLPIYWVTGPRTIREALLSLAKALYPKMLIPRADVTFEA